MENALTILMVDDDDDDRTFFKEAVKELNPEIRCEIARDGLEALLLMYNGILPDLIFLDLNMPRMGGKSCLKEIKKNHRFSHIPVVMYSTSVNAEDMEELIELGATDYIQKPAFYAAILEAVKNAIIRWIPAEVSK